MADMKAVITDATGQVLVAEAKSLASQIYKSLKASQVRKVFTEVRKIEALWEQDAKREAAVHRLVMLKPKLAYQEKRQEHRGTSPMKPLSTALTSAIDIVANEKDTDKQDAYFRNFIDFFEAVLAYHKYLGGQN
ncbi:MAG: type III-A CRISPR-associated protein Csm2 [Anaerolineales bacterium]